MQIGYFKDGAKKLGSVLKGILKYPLTKETQIDNIILIFSQMEEARLIYPDAYFNKVEEITIEFLQKNKIKALILDVDNTLIDYNKKMSKEVEKWAKDLKGQGTKLYILSNTNQKEKVEKIANQLEIPYRYFAKKPLKIGFLKVQKKLNEKAENIGVVGDQIFTDIIGGNRCKMFTILVDPINEKDFWYTAWKRPIENRIKKNYKNKQTKEKK